LKVHRELSEYGEKAATSKKNVGLLNSIVGSHVEFAWEGCPGQTTKPMARLRAFLQSLTTGEAGFMNVCVGSTAFAFALYKHQKEHFEQLEDEREARFHK
jgi:hypothetical protein